MSFYIWVTRQRKGKPLYQRAIYANGLASQDRGLSYFALPAAKLKLPLLARLSKGGIEVKGPQLERLARELNTLVAWWVKRGHMNSDIGEYLKQRSGHLRTAIEVAQREDAVLTVA